MMRAPADGTGDGALRCSVCGTQFAPKHDEIDFLEELFGLAGAECPKCGSFNEAGNSAFSRSGRSPGNPLSRSSDSQTVRAGGGIGCLR
jgi:DNA-directed RNA polymerase subunit RPC12/RpoP